MSYKSLLIWLSDVGNGAGHSSRNAEDDAAEAGEDAGAGSSDEEYMGDDKALPGAIPDEDAPDDASEEAGTSGRAVDASGAPVPLHPALVTLALLPRSQWQGLVHLDAIKARSS